MSHFLRAFAALCLAFSVAVPSFADAVQTTVIQVGWNAGLPAPIAKYAGYDRSKALTNAEFLTAVFTMIAELEGVPKSSVYVRVRFRNAVPGTELYAALQKGVYLDLLSNEPKTLPLSKTATEGSFAKLVSRMTGQDVTVSDPSRPLTYGALVDTMRDLYAQEETSSDDSILDAGEFSILDDAYSRLRREYVDADKVDKTSLLRGAIQGLAESTGDKHTVYFPPTESKNFEDELAGEFEGIGAYVDMKAPGVLTVISPISGSPAEKAGIKGGDVIREINGFVIDETVSLEAAVAKIKGPAGTEAKLKILRDGTSFEISVIRAKVVIEYVEYETLASGTPYVKLTMFGNGTLASFDKAAGWVRTNHSGNDRLIIDLRNNPGGSLDEVAAILSYFVPAGEPVVKIRGRDGRSQMVSAGSEKSLAGRKTAILVNEGSASASEIMAWTIRDYMSGSVAIVGEKTYGKGSVQNLYPYPDGSSLKYTIARWYTGKTETGIDGVGIVPDVEIASASGSTVDVQLEKAEEALRTLR